MTEFDINSFEDRFKEVFVDPDNAGFFLNPDKSEPAIYILPPGVSFYSTEEGVEELFDDELTEEQKEELADVLNGQYPDWAKKSELDVAG